ncbi:hypothetical protein [Flagellimonas sp. CMM7]|uniref:hypothetical protein n=1 Tax=Flagellimonas sp. CMM7 TaxID=2654676 RepID=UPI0013D455F8|nr:hypothetical protein [Flagellimonas sp. CMM7]UII78022.1 hypothetical protein LV704_10095 [Flagellimonas sp. CMM7]
MKTLNYLIAVLFLVANLNCKTTYNIAKENLAMYEVIQSYIEFNTNSSSLYFRTIVEPSLDSTFSEIVDYAYLNSSTNLIGDNSKMKFEDIFKEEEIILLKQRAAKVQEVKLSHIRLSGINISKKKNNALSVTVPIFSSNEKYALMYVEGNSGGDLYVFIKSKNTWKPYTISNIWVS